MSTTQKAFVSLASDAPPEVRSIPIPEPTGGQVLVKIVAAALNPADWKVAQWGSYSQYPIVWGFDGAGIVERVGSDVEGYQEGDHVIFQGWDEGSTLHGTFQEYVAVPTYVLSKVSNDIPYDEAATLFTGVATVANSLYAQKAEAESLKLTPPWDGGVGAYVGKSIFVPGGATQVGQFAIQFAKLSGFSPIVTTASLQNADTLKALGATHVLDRKLPSQEIIDKVKAIVDGLVDLVYDAVTEPETLTLSTAVVRSDGGKVVIVLGQEEFVAQRTAGKSVEIIRARGLQSSERNRGVLAGLWRVFPEFLQKGWIKPTRAEVLPGGLRAVPAGLERLRKNQVSGIKLVVRPHETE